MWLTQATGTAERETPLAMATSLRPGATLGADKGYDTRGFVTNVRTLGVIPHVAQNTTNRGSGLSRVVAAMHSLVNPRFSAAC
jgi:hypothetical protein